MSDLRVGGAGTSPAVTGARYGGVHLTWVLDTLIGGAHTRDLLLTACAVPGAEAYRMGLLNRFEPDVAATAVATAAGVAELPPDGVREVERLLLTGPAATPRSRYGAEGAVVRATLERRPAAEMFAGFLAAGPGR
ncbi:hypothetical protein [Nocardia sp. NPDC057227]|uniref:hypothetical protein n=1 Tax=Nocardia sp. NPDC057227 TaxID=3346056 RepID=UPI0036292169